ncbi:MAG: DNA repair protein RadA, partial [Actinobacteria bacterium]|nr:DNA repair protein RadA [Actinomycetota bacterium]
VLGLLDQLRPDVVILDSIQTVSDPQLASAAGSVVQVRECAAAVTRLAKQRGMSVLLVGHVTKDGAIAGPRVLEHLVDVVLSFEGDRHHALRLLRGLKNRFGPAGEIGCFEMAGDGLREVLDTSRLFTAAHGDETSGVAITVMIEGPRPLIVEVQALAAATSLAMPRRVATGLDPARLPLLVAVLEKRANIVLRDQDLFASAVGGMRVREPAADLAVCLAIASSRRDVPLAQRTVAIGEVGLAGEVRPVPQLERRLAEAARSGFTTAIVPAGYTGATHDLRLVRVADLASAVRSIVLRVAAVAS